MIERVQDSFPFSPDLIAIINNTTIGPMGCKCLPCIKRKMCHTFPKPIGAATEKKM
jgi:hypothetical protein